MPDWKHGSQAAKSCRSGIVKHYVKYSLRPAPLWGMGRTSASHQIHSVIKLCVHWKQHLVMMPKNASFNGSIGYLLDECQTRILSAADKRFAFPNVAPGPRMEFIQRICNSRPGSFGLKLRTLPDSRSRNNNIGTLGPACCDSHCGRRYHIRICSTGGVETHSQTLIK